MQVDIGNVKDRKKERGEKDTDRKKGEREREKVRGDRGESNRERK